MKKLYIQPTAKEIKITTMQMLASSPLGVGVKNGDASSSNEVLSRRGGDFWDDED